MTLKDKLYKIGEDNGTLVNQNLRRKINSNLSLDDANRILNTIGYNAKIIIKKD